MLVRLYRAPGSWSPPGCERTVGPGIAVSGRPSAGAAAGEAHLPSATELLCALGGRNSPGYVCGLAAELAESYRPGSVLSAVRRRELIAELNDWGRRYLPPPAAGARVHEQSLGELIDVMAVGAARAFHLLMHDDPASERMHAEWTRLAELKIAYRDLVHDIEIGRCCLPPG